MDWGLREQLQSTLGQNYAIERELGGGGMARVFVATESALGRKVVIKVLPPDLAGGVSIERFRREITTVAQLQHPHIVPLLSAGESNELPYFSMPYVDGQSLRARLEAAGELPLADVLWILRDVAKALSYAHRHGVVHRDIKPDNVLLNEGSAVVTDFGVAKALSASVSGDTITSIGMALGTPAYMAPEQIAASPTIDSRADIYAFGAMAYEMIAGHPPFAGRSAPQTLAAHSLETPISIERHRPSIPLNLAQLVMRCLEKRPGDRPQTADEVLQELNTITASAGAAPSTLARVANPRRLSRWAIAAAALLSVAIVGLALRQALAAPTLNPRRVAVAPFENNTGDPSLDPVGRIASDWITHGISQLDSVDVVASASVGEATRGAAAGDVVKLLAEQAKAGTVVWGAYHRHGDSLRFQVQVTDAATGKVMRSLEPVSATVADPLPAISAIRERLLTEIALSDAQRPRAGIGQPPLYAAYREFAIAVEKQIDEQNPGAAIPHLLRAIQLDSTFFAAYGFLSAALWNINQRSASDSVSRAVQRFRATARGPDVDLLDYMAARERRDQSEQLRLLRKWARRDSTGFQLRLLARQAVDVNRPREALTALSRAGDVGRRPSWSVGWVTLADAHHQLGEFKEELEAARLGRSYHPTDNALANAEVRALAALGKVTDLRAMLDSVKTAESEASYRPVDAMRIAANELRAHGHPEEAKRLYAETLGWLENLARTGRLPRGNTSFALTLLDVGQLDSAYAVISRIVATDTTRVSARGLFGIISARRGDTTSARATITWLSATGNRYPDFSPGLMRARIHAVLGENANAVAALKDALAQGEPFSMLLHRSREFDGLRDYPPYRQLLTPKD